MLFRLLRSALVGVSVAIPATIVYLAGLWTYLRFVFIPTHRDIGYITGRSPWALWIAFFVAGFAWDWHRSRRRGRSSAPNAGSPGPDSC